MIVTEGLWVAAIEVRQTMIVCFKGRSVYRGLPALVPP